MHNRCKSEKAKKQLLRGRPYNGKQILWVFIWFLNRGTTRVGGCSKLGGERGLGAISVSKGGLDVFFIFLVFLNADLESSSV